MSTLWSRPIPNPVAHRARRGTNRIIKRWALFSEIFGFHRPLPHQTEMLYDSRRSAIAARLSGSLYQYRPVKIELHQRSER